MGTSSGPNIVKDGLVLYLDAANEKSFRGEPTVNYLSDGLSGYNAFNPSNWKGTTLSIVGTSELGTPILEYNTVGTSYTYTHDYILDDDLTTLSSKTVTLSLYIKRISSSATGRIRIYDNVTGYSYYSIKVETYFKRFEVTKTLGSNPTRIFVMIDNTGGGVYHFHSTQLEEKDYATPFVNGIRGSDLVDGGGWVDLSENNNHAEFTNEPIFNFNGVGVLNFNGISDGISMSSIILNSQSSTLSIWVYISDFNITKTNKGRIIIRGLSNYTSLIAFYNGGYGFETDTNSDPTESAGRTTPAILSSSIIAGQWFNFSLVFNLGISYGYVNGNLIDTRTISNNLTFHKIGDASGMSNTYPDYFKGYLSNFKVYDIPLTSNEILKNYTMTKSRFNI